MRQIFKNKMHGNAIKATKGNKMHVPELETAVKEAKGSEGEIGEEGARDKEVGMERVKKK